MNNNQLNLHSGQQFMSDSIVELAAALAKAQGEFTVALKDKDNPFFKSSYADFESVVRASRPSLTKYGLSVIQSPFVDENGDLHLITLLMHASGQWIKSKARHMPLKADIQALSSYNTYLKRMCYQTLIGVVASNEDDDGEQAVASVRDQAFKVVPRETPKSVEIIETITKDQIEQIEYELDGFPEIAKRVIDSLKIEELSQMPKSRFMAAIIRIREIKSLESKK